MSYGDFMNKTIIIVTEFIYDTSYIVQEMANDFYPLI